MELAPGGGAVQTEDTLNFGDRIQLEQTLPTCLQGPCSLSLSAPVGAIWKLTTHPEGDRIRVTLTHLSPHNRYPHPSIRDCPSRRLGDG